MRKRSRKIFLNENVRAFIKIPDAKPDKIGLASGILDHLQKYNYLIQVYILFHLSMVGILIFFRFL